MVRIITHLMWPRIRLRSVLSPESLQKIEAAIQEAERGHSGEIRLCIEGSLLLVDLLRDVSPRDRARKIFAEDNVWDTAQNTGILIYVLLADRALEIVCDRGIRVPHEVLSQWIDSFLRDAKNDLQSTITKLLRSVGDFCRETLPPGDRSGDEISNKPRFV